ncbi:hypothetical protein [Mycobacterium sp. IDR2000157661]|uniref:hypothetical protein n=1 Tax=Mycobacterium sp. IDR2000157661 TaxID=2867005 RepID=UPI001EEBEEFE|nr:hypothetical protein [Mycobacterium sp. IDR2000157661]ULE32582.1 hypothetical protein K3G64_21195 [Mycobacterium sp. IDR2000157661]
MSGLSRHHISRAAYWIGEEIRRRQQFGITVPTALRDLHAALNRELSAAGKPQHPDSPAWKTTKQLADEWGCTPKTVRNRARAAGMKPVAGRYIFPEDT